MQIQDEIRHTENHNPNSQHQSGVEEEGDCAELI